MLNYLWAGMIIIGIIYGAFTGKMPDITNAALDSAKDAVTLCITMVGVMAFWMGIMEIASRAGIIEMAWNAGTGRIRTGKADEKSAGKGKKARRGIQ